jgi:drug/metabolite transporter (DMT)-like permease
MMPNWLNYALLSAAILGAVNIIDAHILYKRIPSLKSYLLLIGTMLLVLGVTFSVIFPVKNGIAGSIVSAMSTGILRTVAVIILFYTLKKEEVSRSIPIFYTYPIFVALTAVPFFGEKMSSFQWLAVVAIAAGAVVLGVRRTKRSIFRLTFSFWLLLGAAVLMAGANILSKYSLETISNWNLYWITTLCMSVAFLGISFRHGTIEEVLSMRYRNRIAGLVMMNESLSIAGIGLTFLAVQLGPGSLAAALLASRPLFVLFYSLILGLIAPSFLIEGRSTRKGILVRAVGTIMICAGIVLIYIT